MVIRPASRLALLLLAAELWGPSAAAAPARASASRAASGPARARAASGPARARAVSGPARARAVDGPARARALDARPAALRALAPSRPRAAPLREGVAAPLRKGVAVPLSRRGAAELARYEERRARLATRAETGHLETLPVTPRELSRGLLRQIRKDKPELILLDYDDTLAPFAQPAGPEVGQALRAAMDQGIKVAILTDRGDREPPGSKHATILDSLAGLSNEHRAGLYVGAGSGSRVRRFTRNGQARLLAEEPGWTPEQQAAMKPAIEVVRQRFQFERVNESEHSYSLIFPQESTALPAAEQLARAREAASLWQAELDRRGLPLRASGRTSKDPAKNPAYVVVSKLDKSVGVRQIMRLAKVSDPKKVLILGDSFFEPSVTDMNMARGAPGATVISVGGLMDPRITRGFVWRGKGQPATLEILAAISRKR